jgi:small redox-active disulfide protein 2
VLIQVLAAECDKCNRLDERVRQAVRETGVDAEVEKIEDIQRIIAFDVLMTPALAINGEVKTAGRLPSVEEIKRLILAAR